MGYTIIKKEGIIRIYDSEKECYIGHYMTRVGAEQKIKELKAQKFREENLKSDYVDLYSN